jgi:hypothetical protein
MLDRPGRCLNPRAEIELGANVRTVRLHGPLADHKPLAHLVVRKSLRDQPHDFQLTRRQARSLVRKCSMVRPKARLYAQRLHRAEKPLELDLSHRRGRELVVKCRVRSPADQYLSARRAAAQG